MVFLLAGARTNVHDPQFFKDLLKAYTALNACRTVGTDFGNCDIPSVPSSLLSATGFVCF